MILILKDKKRKLKTGQIVHYHDARGNILKAKVIKTITVQPGKYHNKFYVDLACKPDFVFTPILMNY